MYSNFNTAFTDNPSRLSASDYEPRICAINEEYAIFSTSKLINSYRAAIMKKVNEVKKHTKEKLLHSSLIPKANCDVTETSPKDRSALPGIVKASVLLKGSGPPLPTLKGFQSASELCDMKEGRKEDVSSSDSVKMSSKRESKKSPSKNGGSNKPSPTKSESKLQKDAKSCHKITNFFKTPLDNDSKTDLEHGIHGENGGLFDDRDIGVNNCHSEKLDGCAAGNVSKNEESEDHQTFIYSESTASENETESNIYSNNFFTDSKTARNSDDICVHPTSTSSLFDSDDNAFSKVSVAKSSNMQSNACDRNNPKHSNDASLMDSLSDLEHATEPSNPDIHYEEISETASGIQILPKTNIKSEKHSNHASKRKHSTGHKSSQVSLSFLMFCKILDMFDK